jgi:prepilin-type N-terminal cleavage/methylation domain-containing protein
MARRCGQDGFTLLEVLIAFAILSIAIVSLIELTSQGLRLLKLSGDHQEAVQLADRIAMDTQVNPDDIKPDTPMVDNGEEGNFSWERRIARLQLPDEIEARATIPGREVPGLYAVSVAVTWGRNQKVEVDTLRAPSPPPPATGQTSTQAQPTGQPQGQQPQGQQPPGRQPQGQNQPAGPGGGTTPRIPTIPTPTPSRGQ